MKISFTLLNRVSKKQSLSTGFTLVELLVAIVITSIVLTITGFGVAALTNRNIRERAETERRVELNRALDFIADEVRQARPITTGASANLDKIAPGFNPADKTPVLTLQIPGISQRIIYYTTSSNPPWLGPKVIYRWGPHLGNDGRYTNASNDPPSTCNSYSTCNPSNWQGRALIDLILDSTPSPNPNCATDWTANPTVSNRQGFYTCIDPTGTITEIHLRGKLIDGNGNSREPLEVSSKVTARPYNPPFTLGSSTAPSIGSGGTLTTTEPSTAYFEVLGGSMDCPGKGEIPTTTTLNVTQGGTTTNNTLPSTTKALNLPVASGTKIAVTGFANNSFCYSAVDRTFNSETDKGTQVWTLRNGDTPPPFAPHGTQPKIDAFLAKYLDANGKIKLAENQVIYLFELFTINTSDPTYDVQDLVVLATIAPTGN